ncbi:MAG: hypothetical protein KDA88_03180 [Planctomycetaceae bacterium]|nr:hypothetical protein [Planctomycetaceae bacterium]MCB9951224.1 hypothetical protein [Planctomycetaceae bacterium]
MENGPAGILGIVLFAVGLLFRRSTKADSRVVGGLFVLQLLYSVAIWGLGQSRQDLAASDQFTTSLQSAAMLIALVAVGCMWLLGTADSRATSMSFMACGLLLCFAVATSLERLAIGFVGLALLHMFGSSKRHPTVADWLSLVLGCLGLAMFRQQVALVGPLTGQTLGLVLFLPSLGWLTRWFPVPRFVGGDSNQPLISQVGTALLPRLIIPLALVHLVRLIEPGAVPLPLLMPAAIIPLTLAAVRIRKSASTRDILDMATLIPVAAGIGAIRLIVWDANHQHPDYTLASATPLLTGEQLLPAVLVMFSAAWLVSAVGLSEATEQNEPSATWLQSGRRLFASLGLLSVAGIPPLPGYWWRLTLLTGLTIPHARSSLTSLYAVQPGEFIFCGLLTGSLCMMAWPLVRLALTTFQSLQAVSSPTPSNIDISRQSGDNGEPTTI